MCSKRLETGPACGKTCYDQLAISAVDSEKCAGHVQYIFSISDTSDKAAKKSKNGEFIQEKVQGSSQILNEIGLEDLICKYITCYTKTWAAASKGLTG